MREVMQLSRLADKGHLPLTGGVLDQTQSFIDAYSAWESFDLIAKMEAEKNA